MKIKALFLALTLLCLALLCAASLAETSGDFTYTLSGGNATLTGYQGSASELVIPDTLDGHTVTAVASYAFPSNSTLTCITLPNSVTRVSDNPFSRCQALTELRVAVDHPTLAVIDGVLFLKADRALLCYPAGKTDADYTVPQGIRVIGSAAFQSCGLTSVTFPDTVTRIENGAFRSSERLASVSLGSGVTAIGSGAFSSCGALRQVQLPDSVTEVEGNPFTNCAALEEISVSATSPVLAVIDGVLFSKSDRRLISYPQGKAGTDYVIPQGIRIIGENAFYNCERLTGITIPDSVTTLEYECFSGCGFTSLTLPASIDDIGSGVFFRCKAIAELTILCCPATMSGSIFERCSALTEVTFPEGFTEVPRFMFSDCSGLKKVNLPATLTVIGKGAFSECTALTDVVLPAGLRRIDDSAFCGCTALRTLAIPDSVTELGEKIFNTNGVFSSEYTPLPEVTVTVGRESPAYRYCVDNRVAYTFSGYDPYDWLRDD